MAIDLNTRRQVSKKPVILRIEFRTWLKSRPLRVLPLPVQSENAIFPAIRRSMITWGGTISPSSHASSRSSLTKRRNIISGILTGGELASVLLSSELDFLDLLWRPISWNSEKPVSSLSWWCRWWSGKMTSHSWSSSSGSLAMGKWKEKMKENEREKKVRNYNRSGETWWGVFIGEKGKSLLCTTDCLRLCVMRDGVTIKALSVIPSLSLSQNN